MSNGPPMVLTFSGGVGGAAVHTPALCPPLLCCLPWCGIRCPANGRERTAPEMAAKSAPFCPLIGGAADPLDVACQPLGGVRCLMASASASGWVLTRARPRPGSGGRCGVDLVRFAGGHCLPGGVIECSRCAAPACGCHPPGSMPPVRPGLPLPVPAPCRCWPCPCCARCPAPAAECHPPGSMPPVRPGLPVPCTVPACPCPARPGAR